MLHNSRVITRTAIVLVVLVAAAVVIGRLAQPGHVASPPQAHSAPSPHYLSFPAPANGSCTGTRARHWATSPPTTAKMVSASTGWAYGPQRTTDGGSHWVDVSPPSIPNRTPINNQLFLDSMHGWVAETAGSATACVDHVVTFRTADGGRSWQQAAPIQVRYADPTDSIWATPGSGANWFSFIDAQNGWLLIGSGPAVSADLGGWPGFGEIWRVGDLYRTTDGGATWTHVSTDPGSQAGCLVEGGMSFSAATTGWIASDCGLLVTHDSGATWSKQTLPIMPTYPPVFSDANNGVLLGVEGLLATSDGGATWTVRSLPGASFVDFINANQGWAVRFIGNDENQSEFGLYSTSDGAGTWTRIDMVSLPHLPPDAYWRAKGVDAGAWGLDFVDSKTGFWTICGGPPGPCLGSGLYKTTDAGHSWTRIDETVAA
jgi:photosystem II stability/assembly factor-like uncharacterized protein